MRSAWNTVSFLAVVHLLALAMFAGWLGYTQRLDRVGQQHRVREWEQRDRAPEVDLYHARHLVT